MLLRYNWHIINKLHIYEVCDLINFDLSIYISIYMYTSETIIIIKILITSQISPFPLSFLPPASPQPAQATTDMLSVTVGYFAFARYKWNHRVWSIFFAWRFLHVVFLCALEAAPDCLGQKASAAPPPLHPFSSARFPSSLLQPQGLRWQSSSLLISIRAYCQERTNLFHSQFYVYDLCDCTEDKNSHLACAKEVKL